MNLGDDNTLGTIDDEGTTIGHQGNISHIYILLTEFSRLEHQVDTSLERNSIGESLLLALMLAKFYVLLIELIVFVLEGHVTIGTFNGKSGRKYFLESLFLQRFMIVQFFLLQKTFV